MKEESDSMQVDNLKTTYHDMVGELWQVQQDRE